MPYGSLVIKFAADLAEFQKDVKRSTTIVQRELGQLQKTAANFTRAFQAVLVGTGAVTAVRALVEAAKHAEESEKRLAAAIRATGGAVGLTTKQLEDMNDELYQTTRFDDEGIREAQANLISFGNISEDVFKRALKLAADLAERTGEDIGSAATKIGKGLQDPGNVDAIAKGIIKLTAAEKERADELVRLNDLQGAQDILLTAGERRIGGMAEAMNTGLLKATSDVAKEWSNLLEELGRTDAIGGRLTRIFEGLASLLGDMIKTLKGVPNALIDLNREVAAFILNNPILAHTPMVSDAAKRIMADSNRLLGSGKITNPGAEEDAQVQAKAAAANARQQAIAEEAARRRKEIAKATAGTLVSIEIAKAKRVADEEKALATTRLDILERFYSEGLVEEREYWQTRLAIQQQAIQAQIKAADAEIEQRKRAVGNASRDAAVTGAGAVAFLNAQKELADATEKRKDLVAELALIEVKNNLDARASAMQYKDAIADVNAQLLELQGNSAAAASIRFEQQTRLLRAQAAANPEDAAKISALGKATVAQAEFNDAQRKSQILTADLALQEERIKNSREAGAISEIRSLQQTSEARKEALAGLQSVGEEMKRIAEQSGNIFLVQQAEAFRLEIERLANQTDLLADKFDKIGETAFADFLTDAINQTKSLKEAFKDMTNSIVNQINRLAAEEIATRIFGGFAGKSGGVGFGDFFSKMFSGTLFGGAGAGAGAAGGFDLSQIAGMFLAGGGRVRTGQPYVVGDGGEPEWFVPDVSGTVIPFSKTGGGSVNVVNNFVLPGNVDRKTQQQVALAAGRGVNRSLSRNG